MANPRKFSEKIALHHQKQAEETAAFEQIMREVSDVTNKGSTPRHSRPSVDDEVKSDELPICISISSFRSGSLPNVAAPLGQTTHDAEVKPEEMTLSTQWTQLSSPEMGSVGRPIHRSRSTTHASQSVGPMRPSRKLDTSPYGSNIYLSPPPPDGGMWRRTHSDSALHQSSSLGSPGSVSPHTHTAHLPGHHSYHPVPHASPHSQQHTHSQHSLHTAHLHQQHQYMPMAGQQHSPHRRVTDSNLESMLAMAVHGNQHQNPERPRSSCDTPRVPGISVYPSHDLNSQNQAYSNHGKHSHPHQHPQPHPQLQVPTCAGTGSLPDLTSVRSYEHHATADAADDHSSNSPCYSSSPVSASPATLSPTQLPLQPSQHSQHSPYTNDHNADHTQHNQNHLSVPNNRYLHQNKGQTQQEQSWIQAGYQQQCSPPSVHSSHSNINIPSPTMGMGVMSGSPHQHSAGGSPGGAGGGGESPQNSSAVDNYYINQALQQHFEQFSMTDAPVSNLNYINSTTNSPHYTQSNARTPERDQHGISSGNNGDSTMCGIPDIILTDFSNTSSGVADLSKELGVSSHLDTSLFPDDEGLREGLDPIDFDGLQMLTDPDLAVSDPTTEDAFRLDRL